MASALEISDYLDSLLQISQFKDDSQNGLQVDAASKKVSTVAVAVDSGLSIIEKAIKLKAQILIVHHGMFWNSPFSLRGIEGEKVRKLIENGCSLYGAHLPLDSHLKFGNAALLAKFLGLSDIEPFFEYHGKSIGVRTSSKQPLKLQDIVEKCKKMSGAIEPLVLPFGRKDIKNIGIVTGSGSVALEECKKLGLDLLVSGESKQSAYHLAKELQINAVFAGHYATETFGVIALGKELERKFKLKSIFIDEPTGI